MSMIWLTRGRSWGFRFIERGGNDDPLPPYEQAFAGIEDDQEACEQRGDAVALRLRDPEGRTDHAGRLIVHDFALTGALASKVHSVDDGLVEVWPLVAAEYAEMYNGPGPTAR